MGDVRIFVCFDVDRDADLAERFRDESRRGGANFAVASISSGGEPDDRWCAAARRRIRDADQVVVICGEQTADAIRVNTELRIAQEEERPYFLLWGRRDRMCTMPSQVKRDAAMYSWTWEILLQRVSETERGAQPLEVPEHYKRP